MVSCMHVELELELVVSFIILNPPFTKFLDPALCSHTKFSDSVVGPGPQKTVPFITQGWIGGGGAQEV